jgi:hypothetical protein
MKDYLDASVDAKDLNDVNILHREPISLSTRQIQVQLGGSIRVTSSSGLPTSVAVTMANAEDNRYFLSSCLLARSTWEETLNLQRIGNTSAFLIIGDNSVGPAYVENASFSGGCMITLASEFWATGNAQASFAFGNLTATGFTSFARHRQASMRAYITELRIVSVGPDAVNEFVARVSHD